MHRGVGRGVGRGVEGSGRVWWGKCRVWRGAEGMEGCGGVWRELRDVEECGGVTEGPSRIWWDLVELSW